MKYPFAQHNFRNGLISTYNIDNYCETDWESDTEIDNLIVQVGKGSKKPKPKKDKPKDKKNKDKKGVEMIDTPDSEYPLIDVIIEWIKNLNPEWKFDIQTTSESEFIESCQIYALSVEFINSLAITGDLYKDVQLEAPPVENKKSMKDVDTTLTEEPPSITATKTLLKHLNEIIKITLLPINDDNEKSILLAINILKQLVIVYIYII